MVILGLQLLIQAEHAGALHGREHNPVQVEDVRFRLQEGLDGSGIRALRVESSLRRPVQVQDVRFCLQEGADESGIRALRRVEPLPPGSSPGRPVPPAGGRR